MVECLHTSSSLYTVQEELDKQGADLVQKYKDYVDHTSLQKYQDDALTVEERQELNETTWPAHGTDSRLSGLPSYLRRRPVVALSFEESLAEGRAWLRQYKQDLNHVI